MGTFPRTWTQLDAAYLPGQAVIVFSSPVLAVQLLNIQTPEGAVALYIGQANHVMMAQPVFSSRLNPFDRPKIAQSHPQAFIGNIEFSHLRPRAFFH